MSFYICHCGNTVDNHNFRHPFQKLAQVTYDIDGDCNEFYVLNALDFPIKTGTRCSRANCSASVSIHGTDIIQHPYDPQTYPYREILFSLPEEAQCHHPECKQLRDHGSVMTHHFTTKVVIENLQESDVVKIINPEDEDIKIIWK